MIQIHKMEGFKFIGKNRKKTQILLTHTSRNIRDYVLSLKHRYNGDNKNLPHYIISRNGEIFNVIPPESYADFFHDVSKNKKTIVIMLENLGWLRKNPLDKSYINWIGEKFIGDVFEKKWRGHHFWQPYTDEQVSSLSCLTNQLCEEFNIPRKSYGHNVKVENAERFRGIVTLSNYDKQSTHLNPSFQFDIFIKKMENE